mmetsp:Transcript_10017/g.41529  ORF Transcript_10017/g.41529 Transcript_10017/m.41529 type:complete len:226 (-) Transcript_10017:1254-1931(-)
MDDETGAVEVLLPRSLVADCERFTRGEARELDLPAIFLWQTEDLPYATLSSSAAALHLRLPSVVHAFETRCAFAPVVMKDHVHRRDVEIKTMAVQTECPRWFLAHENVRHVLVVRHRTLTLAEAKAESRCPESRELRPADPGILIACPLVRQAPTVQKQPADAWHHLVVGDAIQPGLFHSVVCHRVRREDAARVPGQLPIVDEERVPVLREEGMGIHLEEKSLVF